MSKLSSPSRVNFEKLRVYQQALNLVDLIYKMTKEFPKSELYGLTSQLRRAAISIPLNIAEGQGRLSKAENKNFLLIARGSGYEVIALLEIAYRQKLITKNQKIALRKETLSIVRQLSSLINYLKT